MSEATEVYVIQSKNRKSRGPNSWHTEVAYHDKTLALEEGLSLSNQDHKRKFRVMPFVPKED